MRVYDWSFYSQGTQQQASADDFFAKALEWFGETDLEKYKDPWSKGERLAELVRQQRTLLILDGMEPLQHPPGPMAGELTDPSIKALLQGLSVARHSVSNHETESRATLGLCIVTTREAVPTLDEMSEPKRVTVDLDSLSPQAGAELLGHYGVTGEPDELRQASVDVDGHALALILLGTYLKSRCRGDVRRRSEALLFKGHERYAAHAHKVMASYEAWFEQQDDTSRAAVAILRLMGLFNRPADARLWTPSTLTRYAVNTSRSNWRAVGVSPLMEQLDWATRKNQRAYAHRSPQTCRTPRARLTAACMSTSNSPPPNCPTTSTT